MVPWTCRFDRLARDTSCRDSSLLARNTRVAPQDLLRYGHAVAASLGVDLRVQQRTDSDRSDYGVAVSAGLTYLPWSWEEREDFWRAELLHHELVHNRQWRKYRLFGLRWALSPRFRVAMELQAYQESVSTLVLMGVHRSCVLSWISHHCQQFQTVYRAKQVRVDVVSYLLRALEETENRLEDC